MITTPASIDVDLGRVSSPSPRLDPIADAYNLDLWMQEAALESILASKIDPEQLSSAFQYGIRETIGDGPPFRITDDAPHVLDIQVVDWGLRVQGWRNPAVFYYQVRVLGTRPDGRPFYRTNFRCYGDAGPMRWLQASLSTGPAAIQALDPTLVQTALAQAANQCGQAFAQRVREHSNNP